MLYSVTGMKDAGRQQKKEKVAQKITIFSFLSELHNWVRRKPNKIPVPLDTETTLVVVKRVI